MCIERSLKRRSALVGGSLLLATLGACNGTSSYLDATGVAGHDEAVLGRWLTGVALAVVILVCIAICAGIARHRDSSPSAASNGIALTPHHDGMPGRNEIHSGLRWIYVGLGMTVIVLLVAFSATMVTLNAASHPSKVPSLTLDVTAHQWWWEIRYSDATRPFLGFVTANEVHLPVGQPVRVRLHSADVIHSFWLPQLAGKTDVIPGQVNETWLQATRVGTSRGMCAEYCGIEHAFMNLAVTTESPAAFSQWASDRRAEAVTPASGEARAGQIVFERSCGACHAVAGTQALGRMGPDLTHLASRPSIGAGALDNTADNLARWIRHAPEIKEGARMPDIPLDDAELHAVVAYLQTLR